MKYDLDPDTRAVLDAVLAGDDVEIELLYEPGLWRPVITNLIEKNLRLKPRTIRIGEYDVPEPMRVAPAMGVVYFVTVVSDPEMPNTLVWDNARYEKQWLSFGQCHATKEAAITHGKALRSLTEVKP